jgi:hypothetical protein
MSENNNHKPDPKKKGTSLQEEVERESLLKAISNYQMENKSLQGQVASAAPEILEELKVRNKELKTRLLQIEKDLAMEMLRRKIPLDAAALNDRFQTLKIEVLDYCQDRKLNPQLWKKLESL